MSKIVKISILILTCIVFFFPLFAISLKNKAASLFKKEDDVKDNNLVKKIVDHLEKLEEDCTK